MNNEKLLHEIVSNYDYAVEAIESNLQEDHDRQARAAQRRGGSVTFRNDRIEAADLHERAAQSVSIAREDALKAIDKALGEARNAITDAPTDEEARYIVSVSGRSDMTRDEIAAALDRYKGHAAQHAIRAAAVRSDIKEFGIKTDPERRLEMLGDLREKVDRDFGYYAILGSSKNMRDVVRVNYEHIINSNGEEQSVSEWSRTLFGDHYAPEA